MTRTTQCLRANLESLQRTTTAKGTGLTLICLPLNRDSSRAKEVLTDSLSENSIYANLKRVIATLSEDTNSSSQVKSNLQTCFV